MQSPNGTRYIVQVYDTRLITGWEATIQQIGRAENRPVLAFVQSRQAAVDLINSVLRKIGVQID